MKRSGYIAAAGLVALILLFPLLFAFVRTAMVFTMFEPAEGILGISGATLGKMAAGVVDLSVVGFIVGRMVAELLPEGSQARRFLSRWGMGGMVAVVSTQVAISFLVGGLSGWRKLLDQLDAAGLSRGWALIVSGVAWFLVSALVPFLIYALSESLAHLIREAIVTGPQSETEQLAQWLEQSKADLVQTRADAVQEMNDARSAEVAARNEAERRRIEVDDLKRQLVAARQPVAPTRSTVVAYAEQRVAGGTDLAKVAEELGFSYTTLRGWVAAARNGHAEEVLR